MIGGKAMRIDGRRPARTSFERHAKLARFGRRFAWLAVVPALLLAGVAQWAMISACPRLPTNIGPPNIGPRGPTLNSVGPRFDPTFRTQPSGGALYGTGGGT